jgi:aryl-alcohol dehydrogenase-like predicted oxidoreductase
MAEATGLTVAAWSPLADGILSGKLTAGTPPSPAPGSIPPASATTSAT